MNRAGGHHRRLINNNQFSVLAYLHDGAGMFEVPFLVTNYLPVIPLSNSRGHVRCALFVTYNSGKSIIHLTLTHIMFKLPFRCILAHLPTGARVSWYRFMKHRRLQ